MSYPSPIRSDRFSHDLLVHDGDDDLLAGTRAFVEQGLSSGGQVIVHSTRERVAMLRDALEPHPRLEFGLDEDLYQSPTSTLFADTSPPNHFPSRWRPAIPSSASKG